MENEMEEIQVETKKNQSNESSKINKVLLLQIINIFLIVLFIFSKMPVHIKKNFNLNEIIGNFNDNLTTLAEKIRFLKILTNNDKYEYKLIENCLLNDPDSEYCIYHLISTKLVLGKKRILVGEKGDGSYVLLDDFKNIRVAYSFGISTKIQFDKALADKGIDVYMYDHTIYLKIVFGN